jgi:hypothetical protein
LRKKYSDEALISDEINRKALKNHENDKFSVAVEKYQKLEMKMPTEKNNDWVQQPNCEIKQKLGYL